MQYIPSSASTDERKGILEVIVRSCCNHHLLAAGVVRLGCIAL
jgi:hypothetical protein